MRASLLGAEVVPKTSPEGDRQANGLAEAAVREIKGQVRVLRDHIESEYGARLPEGDPVLGTRQTASTGTVLERTVRRRSREGPRRHGGGLR